MGVADPGQSHDEMVTGVPTNAHGDVKRFRAQRAHRSHQSPPWPLIQPIFSREGGPRSCQRKMFYLGSEARKQGTGVRFRQEGNARVS